MHSPEGVIDSSTTSSSTASWSSSRPMSNDEPDDDDIGPPADDDGDGRADDRIGKPPWRSDFFNQSVPSDSQPMPSEPLRSAF